jgi:hypothetical protein
LPAPLKFCFIGLIRIRLCKLSVGIHCRLRPFMIFSIKNFNRVYLSKALFRPGTSAYVELMRQEIYYIKMQMVSWRCDYQSSC